METYHQIPYYQGPQEIIVNYQSLDRGFLHFKVTLGEQELQTRFSDVFDPIEPFRRWLEAICIGVEECAFSFATEGDDLKFNFLNWNHPVFYEGYDRSYMRMVGHVDRNQLIEAFYTGFILFLDSYRYRKEGWEEMSYEGYLSDLVSPRELLHKLIHLSRAELMEVFVDTYQIHQQVRDCENKKRGQEIKSLLLQSIEGKKVTETIGAPAYVTIEEDYDEYRPKDRVRYVKNLLSIPLGHRYGGKMDRFKSKIVEEYLLSTE